MNGPAPAEHRLPWWKERMVWLVIALPLSAVLAGIATLFIASHDPDDLVKSEYVKSGMATVVSRDALEKAARMGLSATIAYDGKMLALSLQPPSAGPDTLNLTLVHPTKAELDQQIPLTALGQGKYQARVVLSGQGKRQLILEPPDHTWRLRGEWHAPFTEETSLDAGAQNPSTHPSTHP